MYELVFALSWELYDVGVVWPGVRMAWYLYDFGRVRLGGCIHCELYDFVFV